MRIRLSHIKFKETCTDAASNSRHYVFKGKNICLVICSETRYDNVDCSRQQMNSFYRRSLQGQ